MNTLSIRIATTDDISQIRPLMHRSIVELQQGYLTPDQVAASFSGMGLDTQLIDDETYFVVHEGPTLVGCGGWSFRATLFGGNHSEGRDDRCLDPRTERARIRAMYTHPEHTKKGIGRLIIDTAEAAAKAKGFGLLEMAATMAGIPFYQKCGYTIESKWFDETGAVPVPLATMIKKI